MVSRRASHVAQIGSRTEARSHSWESAVHFNGLGCAGVSKHNTANQMCSERSDTAMVALGVRVSARRDPASYPLSGDTWHGATWSQLCCRNSIGVPDMIRAPAITTPNYQLFERDSSSGDRSLAQS